MDPLSETRLAEIVAIGPDSITEADAAFLRARRSYLNAEQLVVFKAALEADIVSEPEAPAEDVADKPSKKPSK
jgi:hypothetical protein